MELKRELMGRAAAEDPDPDAFEGWLVSQVLAAPAAGPVQAMCAEILEEYRVASLDPGFGRWLAEGAFSQDAEDDEERHPDQSRSNGRESRERGGRRAGRRGGRNGEAAVAAPPVVTVELFGLPRLLAGGRVLTLPWRTAMTLAELPAALAEACPVLRGVVVDESGALVAGHAVNLNGRDFVRDPSTPIRAGDHILVLSADPGG
jgi:molybdopterin converting factor small subunit